MRYASSTDIGPSGDTSAASLPNGKLGSGPKVNHEIDATKKVANIVKMSQHYDMIQLTLHLIRPDVTLPYKNLLREFGCETHILDFL